MLFALSNIPHLCCMNQQILRILRAHTKRCYIAFLPCRHANMPTTPLPCFIMHHKTYS